MNQPSTPILIWKLGYHESQPALVTLDPPAASLDDACQRLPGGAYTTLRTYQSQNAIRLEDHFNRLEQSAELAGQPCQINRISLRTALRLAVSASPDSAIPVLSEFRIRLVLDLQDSPGDIYIVRGLLQTPSLQAYEDGVAAITTSIQRSLPSAKLTGFIQRAAQVSLPPGVNEALMLDQEQHILEGLSSNFYAVIDGCIFTASEGILPGITRSLVLEEAHKAGLILRPVPPALESIPQMQEAFLTSTSRAVLPVVQIDQQVIGSGKPGPISQQLLQLYLARIQRELEVI